MNLNYFFNLLIFIAITLYLGQAKGYQFFQKSQRAFNITFKPNKYVSSTCRIQSNKIIYVQASDDNTQIYLCDIFDNQQCIRTIINIGQDQNKIINLKWIHIEDKDFIIIQTNKKICIQPLAQKKQIISYQICKRSYAQHLNSAFTDMLIVSQQGYVELYAVEQLQVQLIKYKIDRKGIITRNTSIKLQQFQVDLYYSNIYKYKQFICLAVNNDYFWPYFIQCYNFNNNGSQFRLWSKWDQGYTQQIQLFQDYMILWYYQKYQLYNATTSQEEIKLKLNKSLIINNRKIDQIIQVIAPFGDNLIIRNRQFNFYKIMDNKIKQFQKIPKYLGQNSANCICKDHNNIIFTITQDQQNVFALIFNQIIIKESINPNIFIFFMPFLIASLLIWTIFNLTKYQIQTKYCINAIKQYLIFYLLAIFALFLIFTALIYTINTNLNLQFRANSSKFTYPDSYFSRLFYYIIFFNSLINSLFLNLIQKKVNNQFTHLLSKHDFNKIATITTAIIYFAANAIICAILAIAYVFWMQSLFEDDFYKIFASLFEFGDDMLAIILSATIFMISVSAILYIIRSSLSSQWLIMQIFFILCFSQTSITQYFYKIEETSRIQYIFIYLSPFAMFSTIVEAIFMTKYQYAKFRKQNSINELMVACIVQMIVLYIIGVFLAIKRINHVQLSLLFNRKQQTHAQSLLTSQKQKSTQNNQINSQQSLQNDMILQVFIPCKISTAKGFQKKKVLQNINFKGYKHQILTFIDYNNQSKSTLIKILLNDQKSDTFLQDDLKGDIFYQKKISFSFCSDKNIFGEDLNAREQLQLFLKLKNRSISSEDIKREIQFILDEFSIIDQDSVKRIQSLSGGTKKKLCLASAFIGNPEIIILNDPTIGLDVRFKKIFWQKLRVYKQNRLIIIGTSDSEEAETVSDKIWIFQNGKISDYLSQKSSQYYQLTLDFFKIDDLQFCKSLMERQFSKDEIFGSQRYFSKLYRYKIQIYQVKDKKILDKISFIIQELERKLNKDYFFYFRTFQTKFSIEEFYKYRKLLDNLSAKNKIHPLSQKIQQILMKEIIQSNQLSQDYGLQQKQKYYQKQIKKILIQLSNMDKQININKQQIKSMIYYKICHFHNQQLFLKQMLIISVFFWIINIMNIIYNPTVQRDYFYIRTMALFCFMPINLLYNTAIVTNSASLLTTYGMNFKNIWIGEWIFNTIYIFLCFFINFSLYILYVIIFASQIFSPLIIYIGSILYISNFSLWTLVLLILIESRPAIMLIQLIFVIMPIYFSYDLFIMNYPITSNSQIIQEILSYIFFPVSFTQLLKDKLLYFMVLIYEIIIPFVLLIYYQRYINHKKHKLQIKIGQIHNIANDAIIEEQRIVDDLFTSSKVVLGHNICKKYKGQDKNEPSLRNIYFYGKQGEILTFIGHNGCGKTTIFNIIAGKSKRTNGEIMLLGKYYQSINFKDRLETAYCTQEGQLLSNFTVQQNIRFIGLIKGLKQKYLTKFIIKMLQYFKLYNKEKTMIYELSEGERKKVSILIAFLGFPAFIIFDEPTCSVDSQSKQHVMYLIKNYCKMFNSIILITTHNMKEAEAYSDRVAILKKGYLIEAGPPEELILHPSQELYRLQIFFKNIQHNSLKKNQNIVLNYMINFDFIDTIKADGLRFIYGLDLLKISMKNILKKMNQLINLQIIDKFNLYKYDLQEVVKYNMVTEQSHQSINNRKERMKKQIHGL